MLHMCKHEVSYWKDISVFLKSSVQKRDMKFTMLWTVIPCNWAVTYTHFRGTYCLMSLFHVLFLLP